MNMIDLQAFREWQQQGNRSVKIEMGAPRDKNHFQVWVYDYDLQVGQFVKSVEDINLLERAKEEAEKEYERLQKIMNHVV